MATAAGVSAHAIPYFPQAAEFDEALRDLPQRWGPEVARTLAWADRWLTAWNEHDLDTLTTLIAPDLVWADPVMVGEYVHGRDQFREYIETFWRGFPDITFQPTATPFIGLDGLRMAVPWRMVGTLTGRLAWWGKRYGDNPPSWAPTNRRADIEGYDIYTFRDGLLSHYTIVADFLTLSQQLGLMPPTDGPVTKAMLKFQHLTAPIVRRQAAKGR